MRTLGARHQKKSTTKGRTQRQNQSNHDTREEQRGGKLLEKVTGEGGRKTRRG